jgi:hypothetical protein
MNERNLLEYVVRYRKMGRSRTHTCYVTGARVSVLMLNVLVLMLDTQL